MTSRPIVITNLEQERRRPLTRAPYRSAMIEAAILMAVTGALLLVARIANYSTGNNSRTILGAGLALLPIGLWFIFSYRAELNVQRPRKHLLIVLGLTMLAANGVGIPLVERVFAVDDWLANTSGLQRIIGYALTAGITQEAIKFVVIRFSVWQDHIHARRDGIAYSITASVGYATVLALNYVISQPNNAPDPSATALRVAGFVLSQVAIGTISGFTLADLRVGAPSMFWLPFGLALAAFLEGLFVTIRAGVIVSAFSEKGSGSLTAASLGVAVFLFILLLALTRFLILNTEARERKAPEFQP